MDVQQNRLTEGTQGDEGAARYLLGHSEECYIVTLNPQIQRLRFTCERFLSTVTLLKNSETKTSTARIVKNIFRIDAIVSEDISDARETNDTGTVAV